MADALLQVLKEHLAGGYFWFEDYETEIGSSGLKGFYHYASIGDPWSFFQAAGGHQFSREWDAASSRPIPRITSVLGGALTSYLRRRIRVPYDFGSFPSNAISLIVRANDITGPTLTATLLKAGVADSGVNGVSILPALADTWTLKQLTPADTYSRGDLVTLEIAWASDAADQYAEVGDLAAAYVSGRGNV
jgi:hypothetical protein